MIVRVAAAGSAVLEEQEDMKALKVAAGAGVSGAELLAALGATPAAEPDHLWIPAPALRALAVRSAAWDSAFAAMLAKVEPFGWYDAAQDAVKAHVDRT